MEKIPRFLLMLFTIHVFVGIVLPNLFLIFRTLRGTVTRNLRSKIFIWQFGAWSIFALSMATYMLTFLGKVGLEGKIGLVFGSLMLVIIVYIGIKQVRNQINQK